MCHPGEGAGNLPIDAATPKRAPLKPCAAWVLALRSERNACRNGTLPPRAIALVSPRPCIRNVPATPESMPSKEVAELRQGQGGR